MNPMHLRNPVARAILKAEQEKHEEFLGVVVQYPGGMFLRVARAGGYNHRFEPALVEAMQPYELAMLADKLTDDSASFIKATAYGEAVVLNWWGDVPAPHSPEAVRDWLMGDDDAFLDVIAIAEDPSNFRGEDRTYG